MRLIRTEAQAALRRWAEPAAGTGVLCLGLWAATRGGWLLPLAGGALALFGLAWAVLGLRRMRFLGDAAAPGMVELDEGRVTYLGPSLGGSVSLPDLAEIRLLALRGRRAWRLRQLDGQVLLVPLDATGAEALFDAFATLPGLSSAVLVAALDGDAPATGQTLPAADGDDRLVWRRPGAGLAPR